MQETHSLGCPTDTHLNPTNWALRRMPATRMDAGRTHFKHTYIYLFRNTYIYELVFFSLYVLVRKLTCSLLYIGLCMLVFLPDP